LFYGYGATKRSLVSLEQLKCIDSYGAIMRSLDSFGALFYLPFFYYAVFLLKDYRAKHALSFQAVFI